MSVKVHYNSRTGEIKGFYPDFVGYASIPEPYIEVDETTWQDCTNNPGLRRVDLTTLKIIKYTPEVQTITKEQKLATLDAEYQPQFTAITQAYLTALTAGDTGTATARQTDFTTLKAEYQSKREAIENG